MKLYAELWYAADLGYHTGTTERSIWNLKFKLLSTTKPGGVTAAAYCTYAIITSPAPPSYSGENSVLDPGQ